MADPSTGRYHLSAFYVSRALHNSGIGSSSILSAEAMAVSVLGAKVITLDTVDRRVVVPESEGGWPWARERMLRLQGWGPKFSVQEWYERLGYRVFWEEGEQARGSSYAVGAGSCKPKSIVGEVNTKEVEKTEKGGKEGALEDEEGEWWVIPSVWMEKVLV